MVAALAEAPGPRGFWPVGQVVQFRRDPLTLLTRLAREYGDVVALAPRRRPSTCSTTPTT